MTVNVFDSPLMVTVRSAIVCSRSSSVSRAADSRPACGSDTSVSQAASSVLRHTSTSCTHRAKSVSIINQQTEIIFFLKFNDFI